MLTWGHAHAARGHPRQELGKFDTPPGTLVMQSVLNFCQLCLDGGVRAARLTDYHYTVHNTSKIKDLIA